jgi:hypothetical protein
MGSSHPCRVHRAPLPSMRVSCYKQSENAVMALTNGAWHELLDAAPVHCVAVLAEKRY